MQDLTVALVQTYQFWENKQANFTHLEKHFNQALIGKEIDLVLLPEMFNTGFSMNTKTLAETEDGESILWLQNWAQKMKTHIGASLIVEDNGHYFNRFVIVNETGICATYNKRHLFRMANENQSFTAGKQREVFSLKGWNLMLQVCYDLRFPVFSRNRTINGEKEYDALIYLANWPEKRANIWKTLLQARAIENQTFCIGLNRVGTDGNQINYAGNTMMVDPWGNTAYHAAPNREEISILRLKKSILNDIKESFPAFLDAD